MITSWPFCGQFIRLSKFIIYNLVYVEPYILYGIFTLYYLPTNFLISFFKTHWLAFNFLLYSILLLNLFSSSYQWFNMFGISFIHLLQGWGDGHFFRDLSYADLNMPSFFRDMVYIGMYLYIIWITQIHSSTWVSESQSQPHTHLVIELC